MEDPERRETTPAENAWSTRNRNRLIADAVKHEISVGFLLNFLEEMLAVSVASSGLDYATTEAEVFEDLKEAFDAYREKVTDPIAATEGHC